MTPLPSMFGSPIPSTNPRWVWRVGSCGASSRYTTEMPARSATVSLAATITVRIVASSPAHRESATCTSALPSGLSQCSGALGPTSPSFPARAAIPCRNTAGKLSRDCRGKPMARSPAWLKATLSQALCGGSHQFSAVATSGTSRRASSLPSAASSIRSRMYVVKQGDGRGSSTAPWMSARSSSCAVPGAAPSAWICGVYVTNGGAIACSLTAAPRRAARRMPWLSAGP